jgi:hypothetical protein
MVELFSGSDWLRRLKKCGTNLPGVGGWSRYTLLLTKGSLEIL